MIEVTYSIRLKGRNLNITAACPASSRHRLEENVKEWNNNTKGHVYELIQQTVTYSDWTPVND